MCFSSPNMPLNWLRLIAKPTTIINIWNKIFTYLFIYRCFRKCTAFFKFRLEGKNIGHYPAWFTGAQNPVTWLFDYLLISSRADFFQILLLYQWGDWQIHLCDQTALRTVSYWAAFEWPEGTWLGGCLRTGPPPAPSGQPRDLPRIFADREVHRSPFPVSPSISDTIILTILNRVR